MPYTGANVASGTGNSVATDVVSGLEIQVIKLDMGGPGASSPVSGWVPVALVGGVTQSATGYGFVVQGQTAAGTATRGNPVLAGGQYNQSGVVYQSGDATALQSDVTGNLRVTIGVAGATLNVSGNVNVLNPVLSTLSGSGAVIAYQGGTWTVQPGNTPNTTPWLTQAPGGSSLVGINAGNGTGWLPFMLSGLTTTTVISSGACKFGGYSLINLNSIPIYLQLFNVAQGTAVTLGTTVPDQVIPLPCNSTAANGAAANVEFTAGYSFSNGLKVAATTSPTGSGLVGTPVIGSIGYR